TGANTFTINVLNPNAAFLFTLAAPVASIVAPQYVMQHDLDLWKQSSTGYALPYPTLSGNLASQIKQYFIDEAATCDHGVTPGGCGLTYLGQSLGGSLAGTGPYTLQSFNPNTNNFVFQANANYWGGPNATPIKGHFKTVDIKYVPSQATRQL